VGTKNNQYLCDMIRLLTYIILWLLVDDDKRIKRAVSILFDDEQPEAKPKVAVAEQRQVVIKPKTKRDEVIDAIKYLKGKPNKTKQDRDKIQMLEVILKNV